MRRLRKKNTYGVYFIFRSMEQGPTFRISVPKYPTQDPNHRILAPQRSRFTHYYFYIYDQVLGPMVMRLASFLPFQATYYLNGHSFIEQELKKAQVAFRKNDNAFLAIDDVAALQAAADRLSPQIIQKQLDYWTLILGPKFSRAERNQINLSRFYAIGQVEYCRNFMFKRNFPIHKIFERSCEIGLWRLTANRISELFGVRLHKRLSGKLGTVIDQIEHGHHVFRAYWKNAFLKQYEKFCTLLRNELCSNNLSDFALKKGLQNLNAVRTKFLVITDRFARLQAQWLNVHVDFPLLQRMALPIVTGSVYYAGIKIHETRIIRLLEVLLHAGNNLGAWSARQIHQVVLQSFQISEKSYGLNQLRYVYSSTSVCAARLLTVAFTTNQTPTIGPRVNLKLPIIRLTEPSKTLSISSMLPDTVACKSSTNYVYDFGGKNLEIWVSKKAISAAGSNKKSTRPLRFYELWIIGSIKISFGVFLRSLNVSQQIPPHH